MGNAEREREQEPRCWTFQSQAERRDRGQTEESWLLFEGIDTLLYDLMRKSKKKSTPRSMNFELGFGVCLNKTKIILCFSAKPLIER